MVFHPIKSCRTVSTGLADNRRALMAERDVATLFIESDLMDRRVVSEAQLKNRVDAFFEGLAGRRLHDVRSPISDVRDERGPRSLPVLEPPVRSQTIGHRTADT